MDRNWLARLAELEEHLRGSAEALLEHSGSASALLDLGEGLVVFVGPRDHFPNLTQEHGWKAVDEHGLPEEVHSVLPDAAKTRH